MRIAVTCIQLIRDIEHFRPALEQAGFEISLPDFEGQYLEGSALVEAIAGCVGVVAGDDQYTASVLDACPELRIISKWGIGVDGIDKPAAAQRNVAVTNTPGAFDGEVADVTMGYITMLYRELHRIDASVQAGGWYKPAGKSLGASTVGVIGLGGIGRAVVRRAVAAEMRVVGSDPSPESQAAAVVDGATIVSFEELMATSDVISVNCPLTPQTRHLINDASLELVKPGSYLVNTGRGDVVDTAALARALDSEILRSVAVDVLEEEPASPTNPLRGRDNVVFGSHNASNTLEASARVHVRAIQNLADHLNVTIQL